MITPDDAGHEVAPAAGGNRAVEMVGLMRRGEVA
jgi:hypothetical protein